MPLPSFTRLPLPAIGPPNVVALLPATVNVPLDQLDSEQLSWLVEFLLVAQEIYDEELGPDGDAEA